MTTPVVPFVRADDSPARLPGGITTVSGTVSAHIAPKPSPEVAGGRGRGGPEPYPRAMGATLNPAQQAVLDRLGAGASVDDRPEFPPDLRDELREEVEAELAPVAAVLRSDRAAGGRQAPPRRGPRL